MRNKYLIIGAVATLILLLGLIGFVLFIAPPATQQEGGDFFETAGNRDIPISTSEDVGEFTATPLSVGESVGKFRLLAVGPVAGYTFHARPNENGELDYVVRYMNRETAHIYDVDITSKRPPEVVALTSVPRIHDAYFLNSGSSTLMRYSDERAIVAYTYLAHLEVSGSSSATVPGKVYELVGSFLPENIINIVPSPDGTRFFYLTPAERGALGYIQTSDSVLSRELVVDLPLRELSAQWATEDSILLTTRPSAHASGQLFELRPSAQSLETVISNTQALTTLGSKDGTLILYSDSSEGFPVTRILNRKTGRTTNLPFTTLPEKCVWSTAVPTLLYCAVPEGIPARDNFPDAWYQGTVHLRDTLWRYDTQGEVATILDDPKATLGESHDLYHLALSPDESHLLFRVRSNDSLWAYTLQVPERVATSTEPTL